MGNIVNQAIFIPQTPDIEIQKTWQREQWQRHYPSVELIRLDRTKTLVDPLYREAPNRVFRDPIKIKAYVDHSPSVHRLTKYGIDETRELLVTFSTVLLDDLGILENNSSFLIGDLIQFDDDKYEILSQHRGKDGYWNSTNIPFHMVCTCNRFREGK